jgi:hypothetical protein
MTNEIEMDVILDGDGVLDEELKETESENVGAGAHLVGKTHRRQPRETEEYGMDAAVGI